MTKLTPAAAATLLTTLLLSACDGQQYVSPDTVQLVVTKDGSTLVNRCNYMPVLLGSVVKSRYVVEDDLKATVTITRDAATVSFEGGGGETFKLSASELSEQAQSAPNPPPGYVVELSSGCIPPEEP